MRADAGRRSRAGTAPFDALNGLTGAWTASSRRSSTGAATRSRSSAGYWISPRWLCPNPFVPGMAMTRATCRKLPRGFPPCG